MQSHECVTIVMQVQIGTKIATYVIMKQITHTGTLDRNSLIGTERKEIRNCDH